LALFGRRPPQGVEGFVMPASKNLHITRQSTPMKPSRNLVLETGALQ